MTRHHAVSVEIEVRYGETDQMGVVHHGSYVAWMELARVRLLETAGFPYPELERNGIFLPVIALEIEYVQPVRFGDRVQVRCAVGRMDGVRIFLRYEMECGGHTVARAETTNAFVNKAGRPIRPYRPLVEALQRGGEQDRA